MSDHARTFSLDIIKEDIEGAFSPSRFNIPRLPAHIGKVKPSTIGALPACLDMLVKLPGGSVILPEPYASDAGIADFMAQALSTEDAILPHWRDDYYAYLTVDRRKVEPGRSHRNEGWHFDGMQGARFKQKLRVCHQYVLSTRLTTEYTACPTDASGLDELRHNWFKALGQQVPEDAPIHRPEPDDISLMSAYQLHRSPIARPNEAGWRTFVRLDISLKQQDRLGNTENPALPAPWFFVERSLPEGLGLPIRDSSWNGSMKFSDDVAQSRTKKRHDAPRAYKSVA